MASKTSGKSSHIRLIDPIPTLSTVLIKAEKLAEVFGIPLKSDPSPYLFKFIRRNKKNLKYLGIDISVKESPLGIELTTSRYAGSIPIKSPLSSKYTVDLNVCAKYDKQIGDDEIYNILNMMGKDSMLEFHPTLKLVTSAVKPPVYFECQKFLLKYLEAKKKHWTKFVRETKVERTPRASTNWTKYALKSYDPRNTLRFENTINSQTTNHDEWKKINYVLSICIDEIKSHHTPIRVRSSLFTTIRQLESNTDFNDVIVCKELKPRVSEFSVIKELKEIGNNILKDTSTDSRSWRIDIAKVYELFVQYVLEKSSKKYDWQVYKNSKYSVSGYMPDWGLKYLEPDLILNKNGEQIVIDAKYKSHMLSYSNSGDEKRKESFRHDLHQVLAYSAFNKLNLKHIFLVYPIAAPKGDYKLEDTSIIKEQIQTIQNPFNHISIKVHFIGIPFSSTYMPYVIKDLSEIIRNWNL